MNAFISWSVFDLFSLKVWGEKGRTFRWIWRVGSGDIDFGVQKDGEMAFPTFRSTTEFHPEIG
ncbi:hypothetical protein OESDEN_02011, partial [Oesophagostomum dentatum]